MFGGVVVCAGVPDRVVENDGCVGRFPGCCGVGVCVVDVGIECESVVVGCVF